MASIKPHLVPADSVRRTLGQTRDTFYHAWGFINAATYNIDAPDFIPAGACTTILGTNWAVQQTTLRGRSC